ncbi:MAG: OsmC family protein [Methanomassiliicoccus sp.]|nr:OsmC family protein [Methanomassiliicoccus sp.]
MDSMHREVGRQVNGIDMQKMSETLGAINNDPDLATYSFHAENEWIEGARSKTIVHRFNGANEEVEREEPFILHSDMPSMLMGGDSAPNAIVSALHALVSCLSVTIVYNAAARGIAIDKLSIEVDGDVDVHGFLGLSQEVRPGFQDVRVKVDLRTDHPREDVENLIRYSQKVSPILDSLRNRIPVEIELR